MKARRRVIKKGEALALMSEAVHSGPSAMWWDFYTPIPQNERCGSVAVVHVRGSLDHHDGYGCDSYEAILDRARKAFSGEDVQEAAQRRAYWAEEGSEESIVPDAAPPACVVLRIDSPGGVVSGLNQAVFALRRMAAASGVPFVAYVDELAASAAYALACACDEIILPAAAICGSVGVISCMYDQVQADKEMGLNFVTLVSGARKADGHPHVAISDAALAAEQRRVDKLAAQFYALVGTARPLSVKDLEAAQAGIFLGKEAVNRGFADAVMGWDKLIATLNDQEPLAKVPKSETRNQGPNQSVGKEPKTMSLVALKALVTKTEAAIKSEKDPAKKKIAAASLVSYKAALEAYKKEKHKEVTHETEEGEEDDEEEEEESSEEEKGNETDRKEDGDGDDGDDKGDDEEDDEEEEEEEEEESAKKAAASLRSLAEGATGKRGRAAVGALAALIAQGKRAALMVDEIAKERRAEKKDTAIAKALNARRITKGEAKTLRAKPLSFVTSFLDMRPKAIINVDDDSIYIPDPKASAGHGVTLPADVIKGIETAVASLPDNVNRDKARADMVAAHEKRIASASNGAGRY